MHGTADFSGEYNRSGFEPYLADLLRDRDVTLPFPDKVASEETRSEALEDFAEALRKWWPYVRPKFRPLAPAWVAAIEHAMAIPLSPKTIKIFRGMMRRDIDEQTKLLWEADRRVMAAWVKFNPEWVNRLISERAARDPMLLLPPEELAAAKRVHVTKCDTERKRALRVRGLARKLYDYLQSRGGTVDWCPVELARVLSSKGGGPRLRPDKIYDAASALVLAGIARWIKDRDGDKERLQLIDARLMLPAPDTFH